MRYGDLLLFLLCGPLSCGGEASSPGGQDAAVDRQAQVDSGKPFAPDAGWTQCSSPDGYAVCGGSSLCSATSSACQQCGLTVGSGSGGSTDGPVTACTNAAWATFDGPACDDACDDGSICVAEFKPNIFYCAPFDLGVLFAENGGSNQVRYADMGLWTGDALPLPSSCPSIPGIQVCGGNCGPCPGTQACTGRSPLHPYSFCVPKNTGGPCDAGTGCAGPGGVDAGIGCFTYKVEAAAQALADKEGMCLPGPLCQSAANGLPGGGPVPCRDVGCRSGLWLRRPV